MTPDPIARIEATILTMVRRANDPRGNHRLHLEAGVDIERAGAVLLSRIRELEPARLSELATAAGIDTSTASRQVARLVADGLVERRRDPDDARASSHALTAAGREVRERLDVARRTWFEAALADFDDEERERFADHLARFVASMIDPDAPDAPEDDEG